MRFPTMIGAEVVIPRTAWIHAFRSANPALYGVTHDRKTPNIRVLGDRLHRPDE